MNEVYKQPENGTNPGEEEKKLTSRARAAAERKEQILQAALRVFARKGEANTSNKDIAAEAGIASPGLIYHYFENRQDLLRQVFLHFHPVTNLLDGKTENPDAPLRTKLIAFSDSLKTLIENRELLKCLKVVAGGILNGTESKRLFEIMPLRITAYLSKIFEQAASRGEIRADISPRRMAVHFMGTIAIQLASISLFDTKLVEYDSEIQTDIFLNGLQPGRCHLPPGS